MFNSEQQRKRILSQMEQVRSSGEVNMVDARSVQRAAYDKGLHALVGFMGQEPAETHADLLSEFGQWREEDDLDDEHEYVERALNL